MVGVVDPDTLQNTVRSRVQAERRHRAVSR